MNSSTTLTDGRERERFNNFQASTVHQTSWKDTNHGSGSFGILGSFQSPTGDRGGADSIAPRSLSFGDVSKACIFFLTFMFSMIVLYSNIMQWNITIHDHHRPSEQTDRRMMICCECSASFSRTTWPSARQLGSVETRRFEVFRDSSWVHVQYALNVVQSSYSDSWQLF